MDSIAASSNLSAVKLDRTKLVGIIAYQLTNGDFQTQGGQEARGDEF